MPSKADKYRAKAQECETQAERAPDPDIKRQYKEMAVQWRRLAEAAEKGR
jgi:hypothetical protein